MVQVDSVDCLVLAYPAPVVSRATGGWRPVDLEQRRFGFKKDDFGYAGRTWLECRHGNLDWAKLLPDYRSGTDGVKHRLLNDAGEQGPASGGGCLAGHANLSAEGTRPGARRRVVSAACRKGAPPPRCCCLLPRQKGEVTRQMREVAGRLC